MTLYLKYRPQTIEELDLTAVRESLGEIVKSGNIPHALLFAGPKGTGKTSAARILAKVLNCERPGKDGTPCNKCNQCLSISKGENLDVIEIDAASHRGIDDIRTLRDAVKLAPAKANKKIYIIDEAHMLTTEASNALLKTLEEPPSHVVFVLATTNPEKLIDTILSRTTIVSFRNATDEEISRSLVRVVKGEKLKIDNQTIGVIAQAAKGSLRDSHKILEQLLTEDKINDIKKVEEALGAGATKNVDGLLKALSEKNVDNAINEIEAVSEKGVDMEDYTRSLLTVLHKALLGKVGIGSDESNFSRGELVELNELFNKALHGIKLAAIPQVPVEIAVVRWCGDPQDPKPSTNGKKKATNQKKQDKEEELVSGAKKIDREMSSEFSGNKTIPTGDAESIQDAVWKQILSAIKPKNTSVEALLRASKPLGYDGKTLTLGVYYKFHKERLEENHHRTLVEDVSAEILGNPTKLVCMLTDPPSRKEVQEVEIEKVVPEVVLTESEDDDIINIAKEIFEG